MSSEVITAETLVIHFHPVSQQGINHSMHIGIVCIYTVLRNALHILLIWSAVFANIVYRDFNVNWLTDFCLCKLYSCIRVPASPAWGSSFFFEKWLSWVSCIVLCCIALGVSWFDYFMRIYVLSTQISVSFSEGISVSEASGCLDQRPHAASGAVLHLGHHNSPSCSLLVVWVHLPHWIPHCSAPDSGQEEQRQL